MSNRTENDRPKRRNRPRVRALCCVCGTLRTTTTIGGSGEPYMLEPGDRCVIRRKCATCGTRTQHAYLVDGQYRDACEAVEHELNNPRPDDALPYRCDYPGCIGRASSHPGLAFCGSHSHEVLPLYEERGSRHEYRVDEAGDPDYFRSVWLLVTALPPMAQPAHVTRDGGASLIQVHPDALIVELAMWAQDHLNEAERETIREALDQPLDLSVPVDDGMLDGTMRTFEIPDALRLPVKASEE